MEASRSSTTSTNPSNSPETNYLPDPSNPNMSTPNPEPRNPESQSSDAETLVNPSKEADPDQQHKEEGEEAGEEEEGECGFCLYMKSGGCRESFIDWENCIEEAEKDNKNIADKCFEVTGALMKCMKAHHDYYEPILHAERAAEEEAIKELNNEKAAQDSEINAAESEGKDSEGLERN